MKRERLLDILGKFNQCRILLAGDFFLDQYFYLDADLDEPSLETGLIAYQITRRYCSAGVAGTIANNLAALGVAEIIALGIIGVDGNGFELKRELEKIGVDTTYLAEGADRVTPTYTKPMYGTSGDYKEINRMDTKNRTITPKNLEDKIIDGLRTLYNKVDAIIVSDQVTEKDCGVITQRVKATINDLGKTIEPQIFIDSRTNIGDFRNVILKPNESEACRAIWPGNDEICSESQVLEAGQKLNRLTGRPVLMTRGAKGQSIFDGDQIITVPAIPVTGPFDIVGAGDSTMAGIVASVCSGASLNEAVFIGNLVASITIKKIGTTGTATPEEILNRYNEFFWK